MNKELRDKIGEDIIEFQKEIEASMPEPNAIYKDVFDAYFWPYFSGELEDTDNKVFGEFGNLAGSTQFEMRIVDRDEDLVIVVPPIQPKFKRITVKVPTIEEMNDPNFTPELGPSAAIKRADDVKYNDPDYANELISSTVSQMRENLIPVPEYFKIWDKFISDYKAILGGKSTDSNNDVKNQNEDFDFDGDDVEDEI